MINKIQCKIKWNIKSNKEQNMKLRIKERKNIKYFSTVHASDPFAWKVA